MQNRTNNRVLNPLKIRSSGKTYQDMTGYVGELKFGSNWWLLAGLLLKLWSWLCWSSYGDSKGTLLKQWLPVTVHKSASRCGAQVLCSLKIVLHIQSSVCLSKTTDSKALCLFFSCLVMDSKLAEILYQLFGTFHATYLRYVSAKSVSWKYQAKTW